MAERNLGRVQGSSMWTSAAPLTDAGTQFTGTVSVKKTNGQSMRPIVGDKIVDSGTGDVYTIISSDTGTDKGDSTDYAVTTEDKTALFTLKGPQGADGAPGAPGKDFDPNTSTVTFTEAGTNESINSGETLPVLFGKTKRLFTRTAVVEESITISNETIAAFKAIGWTPPVGGAVIESLFDWISEHGRFTDSTGKNKNLNWIKFTDGTAEIYGTVDYNAGTGDALAGTNNTVYYKALTIGIPISLTAVDSVDLSLQGSIGSVSVSSVSTDIIGAVVTRFGNANIGIGTVHLTVSGKWK